MTLDRTHLLLSLGTVSLYLACVYAGLHLVWNTTPSLPLGFYWRVGRPAVWTKGMLVECSVPDAAVTVLARRTQATRLLKRVVGLPGDVVCWDAEAMTVNGAVQAWRHAASPVKVVHHGCRTLMEDEAVLLTEHAQSIDSRDLGPVPLARVQSQVRPVLTWRGR